MLPTTLQLSGQVIFNDVGKKSQRAKHCQDIGSHGTVGIAKSYWENKYKILLLRSSQYISLLKIIGVTKEEFVHDRINYYFHNNHIMCVSSLVYCR